ncbi:hypothetical protein NHP21005_11290 [Helicobacter sp. NHP21005]|uniref:LysE/ArgO family amino acid transporter n=1 Tax=Helicobacter felistomachi TaxID=3040201 RepID=UPI003EB91B02|nr:hypothetical protein NHP21005_11290 [Helicobacter sp. NHP21005]
MDLFKGGIYSRIAPKFSQSNPLPLRKTILLTLAVTLLNPHVYLDTVFVIGASALMFSVEQKLLFALGALSASCLWFFGLGYGAFKLSQILIKITRLLDLLIAAIMFFVAFSLMRYVWLLVWH